MAIKRLARRLVGVSVYALALLLPQAAASAADLNALVWCDHSDPNLLKPFEDATFGSLANKTVDLGGPQAVTSVLFNNTSGSYLLSNGALTINGTLTHNASVTACTGKNWISDQDNWSANTVPVDQDDIVFDHFQATAYAAQAMGRPVLGTEDTIKAMSREALTGYMRRHYGPSRMIVAAAGAIEHDDLLAMVGSMPLPLSSTLSSRLGPTCRLPTRTVPSGDAAYTAFSTRFKKTWRS